MSNKSQKATKIKIAFLGELQGIFSKYGINVTADTETAPPFVHFEGCVDGQDFWTSLGERADANTVHEKIAFYEHLQDA